MVHREHAVAGTDGRCGPPPTANRHQLAGQLAAVPAAEMPGDSGKVLA